MLLKIVAAVLLIPTMSRADVSCQAPSQLPAIHSTSLVLQSPECQLAEMERQKPLSYGWFEDSKDKPTIRDLVAPETACLKTAFDKCYSQLKPAIELADLESRFKDWIANPKYRMLDGHVHCHARASLLAKELTEAGFEAKLVQIENAPTLIAVERDSKELRYHDYGGHHWIVQVEVKSAQGIQSMVLDPQFTDGPIHRAEYFKQAIGQDCLEGKASGNPADCNFYVDPPFVLASPRERSHPILTEKCGWSKASEDEAEILSINSKMAAKKFPRAAEVGKGDYRDPAVRRQLLKAGWKKAE
ncbi:MAG: hypothetical protein V4692_03000, partial [Bdellovibrionota bacterium]